MGLLRNVRRSSRETIAAAAVINEVIAVIVAEKGFDKSSPCRRFLRAYCREGKVYPPAAQSNGQMRSMIGCNCLIDVPAGSGAIQTGDVVQILWL